MTLQMMPKTKPGIANAMACSTRSNFIAFYGSPSVLSIPNSYVFSSTLEFINEYISSPPRTTSIKITILLMLSRKFFSSRNPVIISFNGVSTYTG